LLFEIFAFSCVSTAFTIIEITRTLLKSTLHTAT